MYSRCFLCPCCAQPGNQARCFPPKLENLSSCLRKLYYNTISLCPSVHPLPYLKYIQVGRPIGSAQLFCDVWHEAGCGVGSPPGPRRYLPVSLVPQHPSGLVLQAGLWRQIGSLLRWWLAAPSAWRMPWFGCDYTQCRWAPTTCLACLAHGLGQGFLHLIQVCLAQRHQRDQWLVLALHGLMPLVDPHPIMPLEEPCWVVPLVVAITCSASLLHHEGLGLNKPIQPLLTTHSCS